MEPKHRPWARRQSEPTVGLGQETSSWPWQELALARPSAAIVSKANCGLPAYTEGHLDYPHGPETMVDYVELAMRAGARIIGGVVARRPHT